MKNYTKFLWNNPEDGKPMVSYLTKSGKCVIFCDSDGYKQLSALYAKVTIDDVTDTIENWYQNAKRDIDGNIPGKGKHAHHIVWKGEERGKEELGELYYHLWRSYLTEKALDRLTRFDVFIDRFKGWSINSQGDTIKMIVERYRLRDEDAYAGSKIIKVHLNSLWAKAKNQKFVDNYVVQVDLPEECVTFSQAVLIGAKLLGYLNKGGRIVNQFGNAVTEERIFGVIKYMMETASNDLTAKAVIQLKPGEEETGLIYLKNYMSKDEYLYHVKEYDEFFSAGTIDERDETRSKLLPKLGFKFCVGITEDQPDTYYQRKIEKNRFSGEEEQLNLKRKYKHVNYCRVYTDQWGNPYIYHKKTKSIADELDKNLLRICGLTAKNDTEERALLKFIEDHFIDCVDITLGANVLLNAVIEEEFKEVLVKYVNRLVQEGKLSLEEDIRAYQDTTVDEESCYGYNEIDAHEIIDESTINVDYSEYEITCCVKQDRPVYQRPVKDEEEDWSWYNELVKKYYIW